MKIKYFKHKICIFGDLMKIDTHILLLIIIIGVISAGIAGATIMTSDSSMKEEVFDGIKIAVPADSSFVKAGDGVYKDSNYGITINTFKNNDSMINYLKNTKNSKIIPVENQPPQSVAFKKGDTINILVTNGKEGVSVSSNDGELTSKIANSITFSDNQKSEKSTGFGFSKPQMNVDQDFNLIMILVAQVDTNIFNVNMIQDNLIVVVDDYNEAIDQPTGDGDSSGDYVSDISDDKDLNNALSDSDDSTSDGSDNSQSSNDDKVAQTNLVDSNDDSSNNGQSSSSEPQAAGGDDVSSAASDSNAQGDEMSFEECEKLAEKELEENESFIGQNLIIDEDDHGEIPDCYVFFVIDEFDNKVAEITVNAFTGEIETQLENPSI